MLRELDLGPLLARMPSGLEQLVGESGWQLSHGERSRLFIARSLLQPLEARVLDESFAALDPETLEKALACVLAPGRDPGRHRPPLMQKCRATGDPWRELIAGGEPSVRTNRATGYTVARLTGTNRPREPRG